MSGPRCRSVPRLGSRRVRDPAEAREHAVAPFGQMIGALLLSRAIADADPDLPDEVPAADRRRLTTG